MPRWSRTHLSYTWAVHDSARLDDLTARPYCVQHDEPDFDFASRLLEEEGIAYHFEFSDDECLLVLSDFDGGRQRADEPFGPGTLGREIFRWCAGGRLRPRSVHLDDYNWQRPNLNLRAPSPAGLTDFMHIVHPGRYEASDAHGKALARVREQRFDAEREYATGASHSRVLGAGTLFQLEHPVSRFSATYLTTTIRHSAIQRIFATTEEDANAEPYTQELECIRCGTAEAPAESSFRPERITPLPRIHGTQTAIVTAEPGDDGAEINVGGPCDIGCVRVRFHWDLDAKRLGEEPSSCWIRVSQFFAGADHGALWHPRVGNEVIVEYLDGDPDRPIITGRVYNGINPAPENATKRPTYSAIKSLTSPKNGNFNLLAFEDLQGSEEIIIHAARDYNTNVERNCTRGVGVNETIHVKGDQKITIDGSQTVHIKGTQGVTVDGAQTIVCNASRSVTVAADISCSAGANISIGAAANTFVGAGATLTLVGDA